ncbi:hypothetical protein [Salinibacterium sp. GXW1014]|uniref:hypothetical protein n=1 Tax=Salinibacterium sp. GXW1014 TaxID=3377838 RepID=UPI00383BBBAA
MSDRSEAAVAQLKQAAQLLASAPGASPLPKAVAGVLEAQARHWRSWFPADPTQMDKAIVHLSQIVLATYGPQTRPADAGTRQHSPNSNPTKKEG